MGKVNTVSYQQGWADQFYHKYAYDAENRLVEVQTSADNVIWSKDASYEYYQHGPLARTVLENFVDITRNSKVASNIGELEAQSAAILEQSQGVTMSGLKEGEAGDYAFESGAIGGNSVAGKTVDQLGIPAKPDAIKNFNLKAFTKSVIHHFNKKVDFILLDGRNMTEAQRTGVMNYIKQNHSKDLNRLITIGF